MNYSTNTEDYRSKAVAYSVAVLPCVANEVQWQHLERLAEQVKWLIDNSVTSQVKHWDEQLNEKNNFKISEDVLYAMVMLTDVIFETDSDTNVMWNVFGKED